MINASQKKIDELETKLINSKIDIYDLYKSTKGFDNDKIKY